MSATFGITPSDDDKFLTVEALDFQPSMPVRLVPVIGALRHDTLNAVFAG
jgi:hypothetical protein